MQWLRLYSEARNDAKLRTLPDREFRVWFNLLCYAGEQKPRRGWIEGPDPVLLAVECAGGDAALLAGTLEKLEALRVVSVEPEGILFLHFDERQYDKPSDRPEAVRRRARECRQRKKEDSLFLPESPVTPDHAANRRDNNRADQNRADQTTTEQIRAEAGCAPGGVEQRSVGGAASGDDVVVAHPAALDSEEDEDLRAEGLLRSHGVSAAIAQSLIRECGEEAAMRQSRWLPFRMREAEAKGKPIRDPAPFLCDSIRGDWAEPHTAREERERAEAAARELRERLSRERLAAEQAQESLRREQDAEARFQSLGVAAQAELLQAAEARLLQGEFARQLASRDPDWRTRPGMSTQLRRLRDELAGARR